MGRFCMIFILHILSRLLTPAWNLGLLSDLRAGLHAPLKEKAPIISLRELYTSYRHLVRYL